MLIVKNKFVGTIQGCDVIMNMPVYVGQKAVQDMKMKFTPLGLVYC